MKKDALNKHDYARIINDWRSACKRIRNSGYDLSKIEIVAVIHE